MVRLKNLDQLDPAVKRVLEPYLTGLVQVHQNNLAAIFLCGQAASGDYVKNSSNINLLIILESLSFFDLKKSLKIVSRGYAKKIAAPLFLTRKHIQTSADVFPIEFMEIKENHILLYGEDLFSALEINQAHIRLFCEEQIKGKLIRIRQAYLEIGLSKKGIEALLKESLASLTPVLRSLLRLKIKTAPVKRKNLYTELAREFSLDAEVFLAILNDTKNDEEINGQNVEIFFEKYIAQIQKLAIAVNGL